MLQIAKIWIAHSTNDKRICLVGTCCKVPLVLLLLSAVDVKHGALLLFNFLGLLQRMSDTARFISPILREINMKMDGAWMSTSLKIYVPY